MEAAMESLLGDAAYVARIARTLESMHDNDDRSVLGLAGLPVAMPEEPRFAVHLEEARFRRRDVEPPRHKGRDDGHRVAVLQKRMRLERRNRGQHVENGCRMR